MKRHENKKDEELQRQINEQEQSMSELLLRVMNRPLLPLHNILDELREQLATVQQTNADATRSVEAGMYTALEDQSKRVKRHFGDVADVIDGMREELTGLNSTLNKHTLDQTERIEHIQDSLIRIDGKLVQLEAKTDAANIAFIAIPSNFAKIDDALSGVHEQQRTIADQVSHEFGGLDARLEQQHAHLDENIGKTAKKLDLLDTKVAATSDNLAAAARHVAKVDSELSNLREQERTAASKVITELDEMTEQLEKQQTRLCERIDTVNPGIALHFDTLAATIDGTITEITRKYESLSENQKVIVADTIQQQLALQLAPFQLRTKWLTAICVLSFASTMALLSMQLF